jgi:putative oxidoreductase
MHKFILNVAGANRTDVALLLMRVMLGIVFIVHGYPKIIASANFVGFFGSIGIPSPELMVPFVGLVEVVGGALLILGFMTNAASWLLAATMFVAVFFAHWSKGFSIMNGGYEYALTLMVMCIALAHLGAGKFSLWGGCGNIDCRCDGCRTGKSASTTA